MLDTAISWFSAADLCLYLLIVILALQALDVAQPVQLTEIIGEGRTPDVRQLAESAARQIHEPEALMDLWCRPSVWHAGPRRARKRKISGDATGGPGVSVRPRWAWKLRLPHEASVDISLYSRKIKL